MKKHHLTHEEEMKGGEDSNRHKKMKKGSMTAQKAKMAHVSPHKTKKSRSK